MLTTGQAMLVLAAVVFIQVTMLLAQLKLFEINTNLKAIRKLLEDQSAVRAPASVGAVSESRAARIARLRVELEEAKRSGKPHAILEDMLRDAEAEPTER